jgi:hypothetical protein
MPSDHLTMTCRRIPPLLKGPGGAAASARGWGKFVPSVLVVRVAPE